ncbi:hypothetical protein ACHAXH_004513 [Discostella pseudostelligera]|jgi:hypothetical protein
MSQSAAMEEVPMEGVPTMIEIAPVDLDGMEYDYFTDDDSYSDDSDFDPYEDDDYDVSRQDLDALRRMVLEIRNNPVLLLQSPIYSDSNTAITSTNLHGRVSPTQVALPAPSLFTSRDMSRLPLAPMTHVDPSFLCRECYTANLCSPSPIAQIHPSVPIRDIPPLPFQN